MFSFILGLLYPYITSEPKGDPPDGAMVIRCVAVFVGIYQASTVSNNLFTYYVSLYYYFNSELRKSTFRAI